MSTNNPEAFDYGTAPYWGDLTPHALCEVTVDQYPDPRPCAFFRDACHLGHPANCRWHVDSTLAERRIFGEDK